MFPCTYIKIFTGVLITHDAHNCPMDIASNGSISFQGTMVS